MGEPLISENGTRRRRARTRSASVVVEKVVSNRLGLAIAEAVSASFGSNDDADDEGKLGVVLSPAKLKQREQIRWLSAHVASLESTLAVAQATEAGHHAEMSRLRSEMSQRLEEINHNVDQKLEKLLALASGQ